MSSSRWGRRRRSSSSASPAVRSQRRRGPQRSLVRNETRRRGVWLVKRDGVLADSTRALVVSRCSAPSWWLTLCLERTGTLPGFRCVHRAASTSS